uniref:Reverse transcriptase domain-containing protein n=1 Tax=Tanacetum cinerariifolium TaxID=118510 RepID=A0A6L2K2Q0_TANCI|nr:reverse transcriptase domain-containing protein [Tanacetum cinerariifolium]
MRTRSSSNLPGESPPNPTSSNLKRRNCRRSKQPFILEESLVDTMADQRTMAELLRATTEGYAEAIVVPAILAEQLELKHSLINMMTSDQFFGLKKENPHDHILWGSPSMTNLRNKISNYQQRFDESFHEARDQYKDLLRACPHHGFTELHQLDTFYNALNPTDQDSLNSATDGNLLERRTQDVLTIIENKSKQTSTVTTAMTAILKQFQATPPPASVKAVEEICVTCGGAHPYYQCFAADGNTFSELQDNIQGYVSAAAINYNQAITTRSGIVLDGPFIPLPPLLINPEEDERIEETLTDQDLAEHTIKVLPPLVQKPKPPSQRNFVVHQRDPLYLNIPYPSRMHKQKQQEKDEEKLLELANTPLNENYSAVILKKLPEKLGDPGKFLIPCSFSELKCKSLVDLGASINLMPLSVWKKLGLPELISTRMTLELANRAICTPARIARDVFVLVGKFTFPTNFVIVDYESDPRVPLILGRPFLRTARALIDVHGEEMILRDNLFATNHLSGNPTFSSHSDLTSSKVKDDIFDPEGDIVLDSTKELPPPHNINPLSGSTTSSSPNHLLKEFTDELALITFPPGNDDLPFDIESNLKEIEYLLNHDHIKEMDSILEDSIDEDNLADLNDNLVDTIPEMFTDEHALDYSSPLIHDEYVDDLFEVESDTEYINDDPFYSKGEKIKESKLLIDELDLPRSSDFLPSPEYDSFLFEDFFEVDALPSTNNEDKDFDPPLYELPFYKEVLGSKTLLSFSSKNKEKVFKPEILTSKGVHSSLLPELSHRGPKTFKVIKILESPMEIFPCSVGEDIRILDVLCLHFYPS